MIVPDPSSPNNPTLTSEEKHDNQRFNERMKLGATLFKGLGRAIIGLSVLRAFFDPSTLHLAAVTVMLAILVALVFEAVANYFLSLLKAES